MIMAMQNILYNPCTKSSLTFCNNGDKIILHHNTCSKFCAINRNHFSIASALSPSKTTRRSSNLSSDMLHQSSKSGFGCSLDNLINNAKRESPIHSAFPSEPADASSVEDLYEFISSGPLIMKMGITPEKIAESIDKWLEYGLRLCKFFQLNEHHLTTPEKARIYHYYIPVFIWCEQEVSHHISTFKNAEDIPPLVIGFSAPQGCGKSTLVFALEYLFRVTGRNAATISIDDFYLTAEQQAKLRESNPGNALLEFRGNPGSHDLSLSIETLTSLNNLTKKGMKTKIPRYDKSANSGRGDRADPKTWPEIEGPLNVVLFEGWMLGFKPHPEEIVKAVDPQLVTVNKSLEAYYDAWDKFVQSWIVIKIQNPKCVYEWRLQAEISMRAAGNLGMSDEEIKDFVSRYLPAYKAYLPTLYLEGPSSSNPDHVLVVEIDEERNPLP